MNYKELIQRSKIQYKKYEHHVGNTFSMNIFQIGAEWMYDQLVFLDPGQKLEFDEKTNYNLYGFFKYAICLSFLTGSFLIFLRYSIFLTPLSVPVFYFIEVHFLFLFPVLIDKVKNPVLTSIKQTYRIGIFHTVFTVMQIGFFMIIGLLNWKNPFKNWHIGCLSIIIWYQNEIRNRI